MSLGLPRRAEGGLSGDFTPVVKYKATAGRFFRVDRVQTAEGQYNNQEVEITNGFKAVMDLANIEVGYIFFSRGGAPQWQMVKIGQPLPQRPSKDYKPGFRMHILLPATLGGGKREFASAAGCVVDAIDAIHTQFSASPEAKAGKLPVVTMTGITAVQSGESTNYAPVLVISQWVARPAELTQVTRPVANGQTAVQPPVARPQPMQTPSIAPVHVTGTGSFGEAGDSSDIPF